MTKKWDNLLTEVTFCCRQSSEREKFVLVTKDLRQRKLNVLLYGENRGGVGSGCWSGFEVLVVLMVKTTLERCGPFSLVVLSQRRSHVTPLSGHSDQNASETFSNKLQLNKVQSSLRQTSAKTTQVRSKAKTS